MRAQVIRERKRMRREATQTPPPSRFAYCATNSHCHTTGISATSVHRIITKHKYHPYHIQLHQELLNVDFPRREAFCQWALEMLNQDVDFFTRVMFSNEATFHKNGFVNRHNCHSYDTLCYELFIMLLPSITIVFSKELDVMVDKKFLLEGGFGKDFGFKILWSESKKSVATKDKVGWHDVAISAIQLSAPWVEHPFGLKGCLSCEKGGNNFSELAHVLQASRNCRCWGMIVLFFRVTFFSLTPHRVGGGVGEHVINSASVASYKGVIHCRIIGERP
ncbi:hypothetical protein NQ318_016936 [Aromia moschata]|uniref:Uncharacterized protein n=1 Tax=Aromia moschata TaxID=1265417 RepID=A0AAV8XQK5_9CUCU|nr:hypothetical protein NQ318_016936 [Aromia moschata]